MVVPIAMQTSERQVWCWVGLFHAITLASGREHTTQLRYDQSTEGIHRCA